MTTSQYNIDATPIEVIKRRPVGKAAWRMELREVLESEQAGIVILQKIVKRHVTDAATLVLCTEAMAEATQRMIKLNNLYHYKDTSNDNTNGDT